MSLTKEIKEVKIPAWSVRWHIATPYRWWLMFSIVLGYVMLRVVLTVLYTIAVTPMGLLSRLFGKDTMGKKSRPTERSFVQAAATYWIPKHE